MHSYLFDPRRTWHIWVLFIAISTAFPTGVRNPEDNDDLHAEGTQDLRNAILTFPIPIEYMADSIGLDTEDGRLIAQEYTSRRRMVRRISERENELRTTDPRASIESEEQLAELMTGFVEAIEDQLSDEELNRFLGALRSRKLQANSTPFFLIPAALSEYLDLPENEIQLLLKAGEEEATLFNTTQNEILARELSAIRDKVGDESWQTIISVRGPLFDFDLANSYIESGAPGL